MRRNIKSLRRGLRDARERAKRVECHKAWWAAKNKDPGKYPEGAPALSRAEALARPGYTSYWSKCRYGHVAERALNSKQCPLCKVVTRSIRDARLRDGNTVPLSKAEKNQIAGIYLQAKQLTKDSGVAHHVDHIRPLAAGGTHHPANLQIITAVENLQKGSRYNGKVGSYPRAEKRRIRKEFIQTRDLIDNEKIAQDPKKIDFSSIFYIIFYGGILVSILTSLVR